MSSATFAPFSRLGDGTVGDPLMDLGASLAYWTEAKEAQLMPYCRRQPHLVARQPDAGGGG